MTPWLLWMLSSTLQPTALPAWPSSWACMLQVSPPNVTFSFIEPTNVQN